MNNVCDILSTGIGYHTIKFLARKGAKVYLGARNEAKAMAALAELEKEGIGRGQVEFLNVNFGDPRWARIAAEEFLKKESRLDILGGRLIVSCSRDTHIVIISSK